jgi:hypothetical protein
MKEEAPLVGKETTFICGVWSPRDCPGMSPESPREEDWKNPSANFENVEKKYHFVVQEKTTILGQHKEIFFHKK